VLRIKEVSPLVRVDRTNVDAFGKNWAVWLHQ
jgi:hypothetical protein